MTLESHLKDYADFNVWANAAFINWLSSKPAELMKHEVPSSFPNIRDTLLHIWGAEEIWLERLKLITPGTFLSFRFQGTMDDIFHGWIDKSREFSEYVHQLPDTGFQEICAFKLLNGTEDSRPRAHMIHHCLNHSTYHRGQLVTMGRSLGLTDPPSTDFMKYLRQK